MKKIYGDNSLSLFPLENGFLIVTKEDENTDMVSVGYKLVDFSNYTLAPVTKDVYQQAKFGKNYKAFELQVRNYVTSKTVKLENGNVFAVNTDGEAKVMDKNGYVEWQGTVNYKGHAPADIAILGDTVWASYPHSNVLIRFNLSSMREELRIGGDGDNAFDKPEGLWIKADEKKLLVCCSGSKKILELDIKNYNLFEYAEFEEPVHEYIDIQSNEMVLLDSGVYRL